MSKKITDIKVPVSGLLGAIVKAPNITGKERLASTDVKVWYTEHFSSDELGRDLRDGISFLDVFDGMTEGKDFYGLVFSNGGGDSIVRERIFERMSQLLNVDYDLIYHLWLQKPDEPQTDGFTEEEKRSQSELYSEICSSLTAYEQGDFSDEAAINDFYSLLVRIQNEWEGYGLSMR